MNAAITNPSFPGGILVDSRRNQEKSVLVGRIQPFKKGHRPLPSADCKSKIGDMCGDFRAILSAKSLPYT